MEAIVNYIASGSKKIASQVQLPDTPNEKLLIPGKPRLHAGVPADAGRPREEGALRHPVVLHSRSHATGSGDGGPGRHRDCHYVQGIEENTLF